MERQKLANGRNSKVTIYIDEKAYLALKRTESGLIRLKQLESCEWDSNFVFFL